mmetsp:Transcript_19742/g.50121  ORF Transcript_19742/g.50121 Transcript_19742/m.50121 type:complete len:389 (-) Transcript_19742:156-1322(-)|eukprot:CAMPEP_0177644604 /NCGR_PEP_ID=MMETSP0447-20121125/8780_1 /TAXON_ID=0 /ORGANISM="Stygamoeba regulata, Strain BSH-02190019" /LENGTH=388 /DNA_ID=CAMNT_0019146983 /DNA_START=698 /DNA_END=1864 /DNA_ORIENTATION=+
MSVVTILQKMGLFDPMFMILAVGMVSTGSVNTIAGKYADDQVAEGWANDGKSHPFQHPFFQAATMFLGELLCLFAYFFYKKFMEKPDYDKVEDDKPKLNPFLFALPACCDMTATSCMYIGLNLTSASSFQMMRGTVIIFTGIFSMIFLKRTLRVYNWFGMVLVLCGELLVGLASILGPKESGNGSNPVLGDCFVVAAQLIVSIQMVVEEKFLGKYNVPALLAVGLEGMFGFTILCILLIFFNLIPAFWVLENPDKLENSIDAFVQMSNNWKIPFWMALMILSIAFFNFFGISMTKFASATTRMVLDSVRTIVIWCVFLIAREENFNYPWGLLKLAGFLLLTKGVFVYNEVGITRYPQFMLWPRPEEKLREIEEKEEQRALLAQEGQAA